MFFLVIPAILYRTDPAMDKATQAAPDDSRVSLTQLFNARAEAFCPGMRET